MFYCLLTLDPTCFILVVWVVIFRRAHFVVSLPVFEDKKGLNFLSLISFSFWFSSFKMLFAWMKFHPFLAPTRRRQEFVALDVALDVAVKWHEFSVCPSWRDSLSSKDASWISEEWHDWRMTDVRWRWKTRGNREAKKYIEKQKVKRCEKTRITAWTEDDDNDEVSMRRRESQTCSLRSKK